MMKFSIMMIPALVLLAGCEKDVDHVSGTYYDIAGIYRIESVRFKEQKAIDLNGDGIASEDILSELRMLEFYDGDEDEFKATVKGRDNGKGKDLAEANASGQIELSLFLQYYDGWGSGYSLYGIRKYYDLDFAINSNGFLTVEPSKEYGDTGVMYEAGFPMEDVMIFTINYGFYDFSTNSVCRDNSEWRFVRVNKHQL